MYIDQSDQLTQKIQAQRRTSSKRKSKFCTVQHESSYSNLTQNVEQLAIFEQIKELKQYKDHFEYRLQLFVNTVEQITKDDNSLENFSRAYNNFGLHIDATQTIYREWAPCAKEVYIYGDFNEWKKQQYMLEKKADQIWEISLPHQTEVGHSVIPHGSRVKVLVVNEQGQEFERNPIWSTYQQFNQVTKNYDTVFWNPEQAFEFKAPKPNRPKHPKIYETHIGIAGSELKVHSYIEFTQKVLPRIKQGGYNIINIIGLQEYEQNTKQDIYQPINLFAVSSKFGNPDDFKNLVEQAHKMDISILVNIVHDTISTSQQGFYKWDTSDFQYFGENKSTGQQQVSSALRYNYGKYETIKLLLSNLAWFLTEYNVDGFIFYNASNIIYRADINKQQFSTKNYATIINQNLNLDGLTYLMLACETVHKLNSNALCIAHDVSGYPALTMKLQEGGIGFDYRTAKDIPNWKQLIENKDSKWDMQNLVNILTDRTDSTISTIENQDVAFSQNLTISTLFDNELTERLLSLYNLVRILTFSLGGDGYSNFMGIEFGHPEGIVFPTQQNNQSFQKCRRKWELSEQHNLKHRFIKEFDKNMLQLEEQQEFGSSKGQVIYEVNSETKTVIFERGVLLFAFNFSDKNLDNYKIGVNELGPFTVLLDTDNATFGGQNRYTGLYKSQLQARTAIVIMIKLKQDKIKEMVEEEKKD